MADIDRRVYCFDQPFTSKSREEFFKDLQGKYSEVVAIYRCVWPFWQNGSASTPSGVVSHSSRRLSPHSHNDSANSIGVFNAELISKLPQSVKYICHNGAGYDQIDIKAATERGKSFQKYRPDHP